MGRPTLAEISAMPDRHDRAFHIRRWEPVGGWECMNDYWDAVLSWASSNPVGQMVLGPRYAAEGLEFPHRSEIPAMPFFDAMERRGEMIQRWSFTITDPDTVDFVVEHAGPAVLDPLAATGWWAHLLAQNGIDVLAFDLHPPGVVHHPVAQGDAVDAVTRHGADRTLLLAWPPPGEPVGANILDAHQGDRVVYLGELDGNCGDERMSELLRTRWRQVAAHEPPQWVGQHDVVAVFERVPEGQRGCE